MSSLSDPEAPARAHLASSPAKPRADRTASVATAFAAHAFTALGAGVGFLALTAAADRRFGLCFAWLGLALIVDGLDGSLARRLKARERLPRFDGSVLDLVVDFLNYVVTPLFAMWRAQETEAAALALAASAFIVAVASALYFSDARMKTADYWFRGFPACWNLIAFYYFVFHPPLWLAVALLLTGTGLMFAPLANLHPMRSLKWRPATLTVSSVWFICAGVMIARDFRSEPVAETGLILAAAYFIALSAWRGKLMD